MDLQISMFSSFFDPVLELPKPDCPKPETGVSSFYSLAKFGHQQYGDGWTEARFHLDTSLLF
jgi:hypothetical protein